MAHTLEEKLDVAKHYLLGDTVDEIKNKTTFSHGSIVGVTDDLVTGKLQIPGLPTEEIGTLRQLSLQLKKNNLGPAQAYLGTLLFQRCYELGIGMTQLNEWANLVKKHSQNGFPADEFLLAALHLHDLEKTENLSFPELIKKYSDLAANKKKLEVEIQSLEQQKVNLVTNMASLESTLKVSQANEAKLNTQIAKSQADLKKMNELACAEKGIRDYLLKENAGLMTKNAQLVSEIGGREATLQTLKQIGLSETHLLQIKDLVKDLAAEQNLGPEEIKAIFFETLHEFGGLSGLKSAMESKQQHLKELHIQASTLTGEIASLESQKATLNGEIKASCANASGLITQSAEKAASTIEGYVNGVGKDLMLLMENAIVTGIAVGEETAIQKTSEQSATELAKLVDEVKRRMGQQP
ncbi:hypothetical protein [Dehalogenimonas etheniformans]|uniref:Uncharacterized protein n=1 Tax=Dehalogenimonas etheniformans TaxID=1536648 RepID=A0A2P5P5J1_9CHLR|nr:hypothetical protein [Dehalogenimonas etheniformans]PPD57572.1 hypothetical protein JP09_007430 [Dehalogenimonas etheniformans]QNT75910.1 hypothetical protein HX448_04010 [Dehalogenimonas etheniformans]